MSLPAAVSTASAARAFDLLTAHEPVQPTAAPDGLLYCLAKGHQVYEVLLSDEQNGRVVGLAARPIPVETVHRRSILIVGGLIPVSGKHVPSEGRRFYVRSVGWVEDMICLKGVPI